MINLTFGGASSLYMSTRLRKFKLSAIPPKSRAHLSLEERQKKMRIAAWLAFAVGVVMLATAGMCLWLENRS